MCVLRLRDSRGILEKTYSISMGIVKVVGPLVADGSSMDQVWSQPIVFPKEK